MNKEKEMPSDRNIKHLYPAFAQKIERVLNDMNRYAAKNMPGFEWVIVEGYRTATYQNELYQKGRTTPGNIVTMCDGFKNKSKHQSALAVDIAPKKDNKIVWNVDEKHWQYLGHCYRKEGIEWGGDWKKFLDRPHGEMHKSHIGLHRAAVLWLREQSWA